jgi:integrase
LTARVDRYVLTQPVMASPREFNADLVTRFERWLRTQEYAPATNRQYLASVASLCLFLNDIPATEVTHLDIRDFLASVAQKGLKRATICRCMYALRCFFDFLNMGGLINWSPPRFVRLRRVERTVPRVLTEKQMRLILSATRDLYERTMIEVLYGTGARAGEVRSMRVEDVDLETRRIRVFGKCGHRYVLFPRAITGYLRRYIGKRRNGYLFISRLLPRRLNLMPTPSGAWRSYFYKYDHERKRSVRVLWYLSKGPGFTREQALRRLKRQIPTRKSAPSGSFPKSTWKRVPSV